MYTRLFARSRVPFSFFALCALISGIATYHAINFFMIYILALIGGVILCYTFVCIFTHKKYNPVPLVLFIFLGVGVYRYHSMQKKFDQFYTQFYQKEVCFYGTITDIKESSCKYAPVCITIALQKLHSNDIDTSSFDISFWNIQLYCKNAFYGTVGDFVCYTKKIASRSINKSFRPYLLKTRILATFFDPLATITIVDHPQTSIRRTIFDKKSQILHCAKKELSPGTFDLFASLFLGYRPSEKNNDSSLLDNFKNWGIVHLIARSGIHLTIITGLWQILLCFLPLPLCAKDILLMAIVFVYTLLSWSSISFMRAIGTFFLCKSMSLANQGYHFLHILTVLAIIMLMYNPVYLFFLDFQLSFGLTYAIAWFNNQKNTH